VTRAVTGHATGLLGMYRAHRAIQRQGVPHMTGHLFPKGVSGNPLGSGLLKAETASILADLLSEHPEATAGARVMLATAAKLLAISQRAASAARSTQAATAARSLIRQVERSAKTTRKPQTTFTERLAIMDASR
jgi:hypothetical protein